MIDTVLLCYCSCPNTDSACLIANALVGERLAACVNQLPSVQSTYRWNGTVTTETEELLLIKTTASQFDAMNARLLTLHPRLLTLHPYDVPELVAVPVERATPLTWIGCAPTPQGE